MDGDTANTAPLSHSADEGDAAATAPQAAASSSRAAFRQGRGRWTARPTMVGEFAVDARKLALSQEERFFVLQRSGELIGVAKCFLEELPAEQHG